MLTVHEQRAALDRPCCVGPHRVPSQVGSLPIVADWQTIQLARANLPWRLERCFPDEPTTCGQHHHRPIRDESVRDARVAQQTPQNHWYTGTMCQSCKQMRQWDLETVALAQRNAAMKTRAHTHQQEARLTQAIPTLQAWLNVHSLALNQSQPVSCVLHGRGHHGHHGGHPRGHHVGCCRHQTWGHPAWADHRGHCHPRVAPGHRPSAG